MTIRTLRGLTTDEYAALKQAVKALPFPVTLRTHTQRYALGSVDLRATAKTQHQLTDEQVETLRTFCATQGLDTGMSTISQREKWHVSCDRQGINYLRKCA